MRRDLDAGNARAAGVRDKGAYLLRIRALDRAGNASTLLRRTLRLR